MLCWSNQGVPNKFPQVPAPNVLPHMAAPLPRGKLPRSRDPGTAPAEPKGSLGPGSNPTNLGSAAVSATPQPSLFKEFHVLGMSRINKTLGREKLYRKLQKGWKARTVVTEMWLQFLKGI